MTLRDQFNSLRSASFLRVAPDFYSVGKQIQDLSFTES